MESQTGEGGNSTNQGEVVEEEEEAGKEEQVAGMKMEISALILAPLAPADLAKDEAVVVGALAETEPKAEIKEGILKAAGGLSQGPWRVRGYAQSQLLASRQRPATCLCRGSS